MLMLTKTVSYECKQNALCLMPSAGAGHVDGSGGAHAHAYPHPPASRRYFSKKILARECMY